MTKTKGLEPVVEPPQEEIKAAVQNLKDWIVKEPHLPNLTDDEFLTTFYCNNKFSLEKTKSKLDSFYSLKNKYAHLLQNRDPDAPGMEPFWHTIGASEKLTEDGARVYFLSWNPDPDLFVMNNYIRYVSMFLDMLILEKDRLVPYVFIVDFKNFQYKNFLALASGMKTATEIFSKMYTERTEIIHLVNASNLVDKVIKAFVPLFPKKYADRIFVHTAERNDLKDMISEDVLMSDLGGNGPSYAECGEWSLRKMRQYKKWYSEEGSLASNERLRRTTDNQMEELRGSFRKLECD